MNNPYFRGSSTAGSSGLRKSKKKEKKPAFGVYFTSSQIDDSDNSQSSNQTQNFEDDDDERSVTSASSIRSSFSNAAGASARFLAKTAAMPVVFAAKTTKTVAKAGMQAGTAVGNTVATGGRAMAKGTTAVVKGTSNAVVGGTTAVVKGTSQAVFTAGNAVGSTVATGGRALVGGTTAVVKGGSKAIVGGTHLVVGGTSAVVKGSSKAFMHGTTKVVGGTTAITKKTVKGLRNRRGSLTKRQQIKAAHWDDGMETLRDILDPSSVAYQALTVPQRKALTKVKKMLLQSAPSLAAVGSPIDAQASCLPMDLLQMDRRYQQQQRAQQRAYMRRPSNTSSLHDLQEETGSVTSDASYLLQEYGGIQNPGALLSYQSEEFDDYDLLDFTSTSDLSMSEHGGNNGGYLMSIMNNTSISASATEESGNDEVVQAGSSTEVASPDKGATAKASTPAATTKTAADAPKRQVRKMKKPPVVTITVTTNTMKRKDLTRETFIPLEFQQLGAERQRDVYNALRWETLAQWDFDIFDLDRFTGGNALLFMGWATLGAPYAQFAMAHACGLAAEEDTFVGYPFMDELNIPPQKMIQYLRVIQQDYHADNPYHNAIHAADVCQTIHSMIQMALRGPTSTGDSSGVEKDVGQKAESKKDEGQADESDVADAGFFFRSCPNPLKLFSTLLAAIVHDVDHPGKNNAFHSKLKAELAIIYNDKSVLENWHVAHAFARMLGIDVMNRSNLHKHEKPTHQDCDCNLLCNAKPEDFTAIRTMVIEAVLQTDMTKHFAIVTEMKTMILAIEEEEQITGPIRHDDERTWTLLTFMLHQADISSQAKDDPLFLNWTDRCLQEFFAQGDEEAALGMWPISPYCDRKTTNQAVAQTGFVEFVVQPSYMVLGEYIPELQMNVLPIIQENLEFWYDASGKQMPKEGDETEALKENEPSESNVTTESVEANSTLLDESKLLDESELLDEPKLVEKPKLLEKPMAPEEEPNLTPEEEPSTLQEEEESLLMKGVERLDGGLIAV